jgi:hypothetical protein
MAIGPWDGDVAGLSGMMDEELAETGGKLEKKKDNCTLYHFVNVVFFLTVIR